MKIHCPMAEDTYELGIQIGKAASRGILIALNGPLGAGKTSLTQGIARGLGVPTDRYVNSPTFTILQLHPGRHELAHMDWYRISDEDEAMGLGLEEYIDGDAVCVVEWPERLPSLIPDVRLRIDISIGQSGRDFVFTALGDAALAVLEKVIENQHS